MSQQTTNQSVGTPTVETLMSVLMQLPPIKMHELERIYLQVLMVKNSGSKKLTSHDSGLGLKTVYNKLRSYKKLGK